MKEIFRNRNTYKNTLKDKVVHIDEQGKVTDITEVPPIIDSGYVLPSASLDVEKVVAPTEEALVDSSKALNAGTDIESTVS